MVMADSDLTLITRSLHSDTNVIVNKKRRQEIKETIRVTACHSSSFNGAIKWI